MLANLENSEAGREFTRGQPFSDGSFFSDGFGFTSDIPASDRVVPLDHNGPDYQRAIETLDRVRDEVRKSNEIDPEDRDQKISVLEAAKRLLDSSQIHVQSFLFLILPPLYELARIFTEAAIGVAASDA